MNTQRKNTGTNLKPAPQLDPAEIELRLKRGAALLRTQSDEEYNDLLDTYRLASGTPSDYQNTARMFWVRDRFDKEAVKFLPWSVMLELSRPTKPIDVREMLADLCIWWSEARRQDQTPSPFTFPTEKSLILAVVDHPDIYRSDLRILHAKAKIERGLPYTEAELERSLEPTPDLINRVRADRSIVVSKAVEKAITEIAAATNNTIARLNGTAQVEQQNSTQIHEALAEIQTLLAEFRADDNQVIITSLRNHANTLERQLANALQVNGALQDENAELQFEISRLRSVEGENKRLLVELEDIRAGLQMVMERFQSSGQQLIVIDKESIIESQQV